MLADLLAFVMMLLLLGVFALLVVPVVLVLLWLNRKLLADHRGRTDRK